MTKEGKRIKALLDSRQQGVIVDIGCGQNKSSPEAIGIDYQKYEGVDIVHNLDERPWPLPDKCASILTANHIVEHINPVGGNFIGFMDECWRLLKYGGQMRIEMPYGNNSYYVQDPTHCNPCNERTWAYFDPLEQMANGGLYNIYKPKPWKILRNAYQPDGFLSVVLEKRRVNLKNE